MVQNLPHIDLYGRSSHCKILTQFIADGMRRSAKRLIAEAGRVISERVHTQSDVAWDDIFLIAQQGMHDAGNFADKAEFAKISYLARRALGEVWSEFMPFVLGMCSREDKKFKSSFVIDDKEDPTAVPKLIRQCRPDQSAYAIEDVRQVGLYNKNRDFVYRNYDGSEAEAYLRQNFGDSIEYLFRALPEPQARSDFFLIASLYKEGGVSADVCSVADANIAPLLKQGKTFGFVVHEGTPEKKFFFAIPRHPIVKSYLERLAHYAAGVADGRIAFSYEAFSSTSAFQTFLMDVVCEIGTSQATNLSGTIAWHAQGGMSYGYDLSSVLLIDDVNYTAFVRPVQDEENLPKRGLIFPCTNLLGEADDPSVERAVQCPFHSTVIVGSRPGFFYGPASGPTVVGYDLLPDITRQARVPVAISAINVFETKGLVLTGHGCLWKDRRFVQLDSYLSKVAEAESQHGHWRLPEDADAMREIEVPVIVAFGAGFGCYGHYLVDDIPRLGLAKMLLGDVAFRKRKIVIPEKMPKWGTDLLCAVFDLDEDAFLRFDHEREAWKLRDAVIPSFLARHYQFHPLMRDFYRSLVPDVGCPSRRICLSRRTWEPNKINQRVFKEQRLFEDMAATRGFDVIEPESLSIHDQIRLMAETRCQIGEHGSAQHASVFNRYGMTVGTINPRTEVQTNLGRLFGDRNVLVYEDESETDARNNRIYSLREAKITAFLDMVLDTDASRDSYYTRLTK